MVMDEKHSIWTLYNFVRGGNHPTLCVSLHLSSSGGMGTFLHKGVGINNNMNDT